MQSIFSCDTYSDVCFGYRSGSGKHILFIVNTISLKDQKEIGFLRDFFLKDFTYKLFCLNKGSWLLKSI